MNGLKRRLKTSFFKLKRNEGREKKIFGKLKSLLVKLKHIENIFG
jgi:hypothetical protein